MSGPQPHPEPAQPAISFPDNSLTTAAARPRFSDLTICLGLVLAIFVVYAQVSQFDFISYDDDLYILKNPHVLGGLTPDNIRWAFTAVASSNWLPVTLLSHMLDIRLFGLHSGLHHLENVVFHALAAVLLFLFLQRSTGARAPSAFVAFVFALHPLHVESVAWISERKDVLSAFFLFLTLYSYVRYTERPGLARYLGVVAPFCLGLMSKPMLVTLPFILLLLDAWPLRRVKWPRILWEKLPLFALSAAASAMAYRIQSTTGALAEIIPLQGRIAKALLSYVTYIRQMFWPVGLAVFYPYPHLIQAWEVAAALILLLGVSAFVISSRRTRPYLTTGWFWYLGTLVPVIGLVQVGEQSHADRYTYIPMVGLSVMLAWGAAELAVKWPQTRSVIAAACVATSVVWMGLAAKQAASWRNSGTLFEHAIDVTADNFLAHTNLAAYLMEMPDRRSDAIEHLEAALRIKPDYAPAHSDLGVCLAKIELCPAAIPHFEAALRSSPESAAANEGLGYCLMNSGRYGEAISHFEEALRINPDYAEAHFNLGGALLELPGRESEAVAQYETALRLQPDYTAAHYKLGKLLVSLGRTQEATAHFEAAQRIDSLKVSGP